MMVDSASRDKPTTMLAIVASQQNEEVISQEDRWAALERVLASTQFKRAARLREFLLYVGRESVFNASTEIHEQEIGSFVFGRPESYDTSQDNIVRVNASELRKRLDNYFSSEGLEDRILITIPRGSYIPDFHRRSSAESSSSIDTESFPVEVRTPPDTALSQTISTDIPEFASRHTMRIFPWIMLCIALIACGLLVRQNHSLRDQLSVWKTQPTLKLFWSNFFDNEVETDVVVADASFAFAQDVSHQSITLDSYLNQDYAALGRSPVLSPTERDDILRLLSRNNGSIGDYKVAQQIIALDPVSKDIKLQFSREYSAEQMKLGNVILIGSRKSNPWDDLFEGNLNFTIGSDLQSGQSFVINKHPVGEEPSRYDGHLELPVKISYSVIAFVPNLNRIGYALVIEGTDSQATNAAGQFMTSEKSLASLKRRLPAGPFPYFEVVMKSLRLNKTPFSSEIVAVHVYPGPALP